MLLSEYERGRLEAEASLVARWYERCIEYLLRQSGVSVKPEPNIGGKTPDLLVQQPSGPDVIIECLVRLRNPEHDREFIKTGSHSCGGDIRELHSSVYSRVEEKITKYQRTVGSKPYVVALYHGGCGNSLDTALALAFSAHVPYLSLSKNGNVVDRGYVDMWSTPSKSASLFRLYPHLSGLIYSRWPREHYFLPNPFADVPVPTSLFPFACVPDAPITNGRPGWKERASLVNDDYALPPNTWWGQVERLGQVLSNLIEHLRKA